MNTHRTFMHRCYQLATQSENEGESAVGSIVVKDGVIIGEGTEKSRQQKDITRHAEVVAIMNAAQHTASLTGAILYTNVEPCLLCSYVIRHHRIAEVVFAKHSGELGGTNENFNLLTSGDFKSWDAPPVVTLYSEQ
ncbi:nucleoside deaminase [Filimonas effusa]|uniref:Nucleoside deaminase n=1 Tax=Filimonas effusa TaxID=2508721 RepID=A0A4Q1DAG5_9BACT|nr:nucleoside deaminase [Filimonas effusa]RXK86392.1 nucleoside deaminase [Filimonas effusa]